MTSKYQTMKLVRKLDVSRRDFRGAYQCRVCHGVRFDRSITDSYDDENFRLNVIPKMTCPLCDRQAPLSKQYWMALCTLAWACMRERGKHLKGADVGFPLFDRIYIDSVDNTYFCAQFKLRGVQAEAWPGYVGVDPRFPSEEQLCHFDSVLDDRHEQDSVKRLALEVVDRVRHDLKHNNVKEA